MLVNRVGFKFYVCFLHVDSYHLDGSQHSDGLMKVDLF